MVVLQPREVNSTCIHASVLHESIIKYMWFQIRKNHTFYTVAVCSISLSLYIYISYARCQYKDTNMNILWTVNTHTHICSVLVRPHLWPKPKKTTTSGCHFGRHDFPRRWGSLLKVDHFAKIAGWRKLGECRERVEVICELFVFFCLCTWILYMCTVPIFGITYTCDYMYLSSIFKHLCIYI